MKILNYLEVKPAKTAPGVGEMTAGVVLRRVIGKDDNASFTMRVVEHKPAKVPPHGLHSHPWEHQSFIVSGQGAIMGEKAELPVKAGDIVFIPGNEPHTFVNRGSGRFVFVGCISRV